MKRYILMIEYTKYVFKQKRENNLLHKLTLVCRPSILFIGTFDLRFIYKYTKGTCI